ncbi:fibropellin-3-like isoform X2 [Haliotis rufescens]|uniref:fibropellin-3-like isoform X2 n=1 Tax=Haliotis rufescens TaxID=6454 RepID=UPI00201F20D1|nr:fibropellin-3-like isoform X2 [Haliotis rufescens]
MKGFKQTVLFLGIVATMYGRLCMADCTTDPTCSGHGTCETEKTCTCDTGYIGDLCEHDDPCLPDPCNGKGTCEPDTSNPPKDTCNCEAGYGGDKCDLAPQCDAATDCLNGGTCDKSSDQYLCKCAPGYGGDTCNLAPKCTVLIPCENGGTCKADTTGQDICFCAPGFGGDLCADASGAAKVSVHLLLLMGVAALATLNLN